MATDWGGILSLAQQNPDVQVIDDVAPVTTVSPVLRGATAKPSEHDEQAAIFAWRDANMHGRPELGLLFANVNGQYRHGQRPEPGLTAGVPDMQLALPAHGYGGLFIELKRGGRQCERNGGLTDEQAAMLALLNKHGNCAVVCYGADDAIATIERYIRGES